MLQSSLFTNRNFLMLWLGQSVSALGSVISQVAIVFWIAEKTGSATAVTSMLSLAVIPQIILGLFAGSICDRFSRRAIIIWGDGISAFLCLGATVFFLCLPSGDPALLHVLYILFISTELIDVFSSPALCAIYPDLLPISSLRSAIAIRMTTSETITILGKSSGCLILRIVGLPFVLLADGITFLISCCAALNVQPPAQGKRPAVTWRHMPRQLMTDILLGLGYVWREKGIRIMILAIAGTNFFLSPVLALLPFFVKDERFLGVSGEWYGILMGGIGAGGLIGHWLSTCYAGSRWGQRLILCSMLGIGCLYALLGMVHSAWIALGLMTVNGICLGMFNNQTWFAIQGRLPSNIRARADAAMSTLPLCASPPALWLAGIVADTTGHQLNIIFIVCGLMTATIGLWAQSQRAYREFLAGVALLTSSGIPEKNNNKRITAAILQKHRRNIRATRLRIASAGVVPRLHPARR